MKTKMNGSCVCVCVCEREREREREREHTLIYVFPSLAGITQHGIVIILSPSVGCVIKVLPVYTRRKFLDFL